MEWIEAAPGLCERIRSSERLKPTAIIVLTMHARPATVPALRSAPTPADGPPMSLRSLGPSRRSAAALASVAARPHIGFKPSTTFRINNRLRLRVGSATVSALARARSILCASAALNASGTNGCARGWTLSAGRGAKSVSSEF